MKYATYLFYLILRNNNKFVMNGDKNPLNVLVTQDELISPVLVPPPPPLPPPPLCPPVNNMPTIIRMVP